MHIAYTHIVLYSRIFFCSWIELCVSSFRSTCDCIIITHEVYRYKAMDRLLYCVEQNAICIITSIHSCTDDVYHNNYLF